MDEAGLQLLRDLAHDCMAKHSYAAAVFYADKLVTLTEGAALPVRQQAVFTLASAFFVDRQYRRCLALLRTSELVESDVRFRHLAARCLAECRMWEECLALLGGDDAPPDPPAAPDVSPAAAGRVSFDSTLAALRGRAHDALGNSQRAVAWYSCALKTDPLNYEAFAALVPGQRLTNSEELALVEGLALPPVHGWLGALYRARCKQYEQPAGMEAALDELENEPPNAAAAGEPPLRTPPPHRGGGKPSDALPTPDAPSSMAFSPPPHARGGRGGGEPGPSQRAGGWGLAGNPDVVACRAEWLYHRGAYAAAYELTSAALERDAHAAGVLPVHLAAAVELGKCNDLFMRAHRLVEARPDWALSWFAVGCYYMAVHQYEQARRHFGKATQLNRDFAPAWIAFGHAFAAQDESDQAMAAYRTAGRLFPGLAAPLAGMGMEYCRMNNLHLAEQLLMQAHRLCPPDPLVCNELGVLAYRARRYEDALVWLQRAVDLVPGGLTAAWEPAVSNLGHALRKLRRWDDALAAYHRALGLAPGRPGTHAAMGLTFHLLGRLDEAIASYHKALALRPTDAFVAEALGAALEEASAEYCSALGADEAAASEEAAGGRARLIQA